MNNQVMEHPKTEEIMWLVTKMNNEQFLEFVENYFDYGFIYDHIQSHLEYLEETNGKDEIEQIKYLANFHLGRNNNEN